MKARLAEADLNLQSWVSLQRNYEKTKPKTHPLGGNGEEKVQGAFWDKSSDTFQLFTFQHFSRLQSRQEDAQANDVQASDLSLIHI